MKKPGCDNGPPYGPGEPRNQQSLFTCFTNDASTSIALGSTAKLDQDVLYQAPVTTIPSSSEKISIRYSILVKQYALTKPAYEFWTNVKKNTENLGSIFDAQPSAPASNIHCISDAAQPVIGYISVGTIQRKRIFVDKTDVRSFITAPQNLCGLETTIFTNSKICYPRPGKLIVDYIYSGSDIIGITQTLIPCADCTTRGVLKKPSFWK
jgi:hypothetical protein